MRFRKVSVAAAIAVLAGVTSTIGTATSAWADTAVPLSLSHYSHMVVDGGHDHLFVSGGSGSTGILVTDFSGSTVGTVAEPGATSMALSPDGGTLYVALPGSDAVAAVDTATLTETARYDTGAGTGPSYVACAGGRIWFSYGDSGQGGIGSIDPSGDQPVVALHPGGWYAAPALTSSPSAPNLLIGGETAVEPSQLKVIDVSSGSPVVTASRSDAGTFVADMAVTPDGKDVVVASGSPYYHQVYKLSDLSEDGKFQTTTYPDAVAIAPDGTVAAGIDGAYEPDVYVFGAGDTSARHTYDFGVVGNPGTATELARAGLAWDPDGSRIFAVTADVYGDDPTLRVLTDPEKAGTQLTVSKPQFGVPHTPLTITGQLSSAVAFAAGQVVHVTRTDPADPDGVALADVPVAADGTFSFTDTPTSSGDFEYAVGYAGDASHAAVTATAQAVVDKAAATLLLDGPATATRGSSVKLTGSLTSPTPFAAGQVVHVGRKDASGTVSLPDARVAADGSFSFTDTPQVGGVDNYTVSFAGDDEHVASTANHEVQVSRAATAVSVTTGATNYTYDATAKVTAHLGTTYNSRTVSLYAQPYGGAKVLIKTGTVDSHGNLATTYKVARYTTFTATFAGDYRYAAASSASHAVHAYARVTEALKGYYTSTTTGGITYRVYHHTTDPLQGTTISPAKNGECAAFTAQAYVSGAWRTIAKANCVTIGTGSTAWAKLTGSHPTGYHYRFQAEFVHSSTDQANMNTYGSWLYFTFRT